MATNLTQEEIDAFQNLISIEDDNMVVNLERHANDFFQYSCDPLALVLYWIDRDEVPYVPNEGVYLPNVVNALSMHTVHKKYYYLYDPPAEYIEQATTIRDFYIAKFANYVLMGTEMSQFQKSLSAFLSDKNSTSRVHSSKLGMLVSLPRLYEEDLMYDDLINKYTSYDLTTKYPETHYRNLKFVSTVPMKNSEYGSKYYTYWLSDEDNYLYQIKFKTNNNEFHLFDSILKICNNNIKVEFNGMVDNLFGTDFKYMKVFSGFTVCD